MATMEFFSENSRYINDLKTLTDHADGIIQNHQQLMELDLSLNINRESLSALRRGCYSPQGGKRGTRLEDLEFSKFETTNKLLRLGDFFISTTPYVIHRYLLSEKEALEELIYLLRTSRYEKVESFLKLHPNIPDDYLSDINFIIRDTKRDKPYITNNKSAVDSNKYKNHHINFVPRFCIFDNPEFVKKLKDSANGDSAVNSRDLDFHSVD